MIALWISAIIIHTAVYSFSVIFSDVMGWFIGVYLFKRRWCHEAPFSPFIKRQYFHRKDALKTF